LIPSPNVTDNHQEKNARVLADKGGAVLLLEKQCSARALYDETRALLDDAARREAMSIALKQSVILDSAERICAILENMAKDKT